MRRGYKSRTRMMLCFRMNLTLVSKKTQQKVKACALQAKDVEWSLKSNYEKELNVMFAGEKYTWRAIETVATNDGRYVA